MKKVVCLICSIIFLFTLIGCGQKEKTAYEFYVPDGAPALAVAKLILDKENFNLDREVNYSVVSSNDIGLNMTQKKEFVVIPVNASTKLYDSDKEDPYVMAGVITHGNLYLASKNEYKITDLKGKVVGIIGQGLVPDLTFRAVLKKYGIEWEVSESAVENKVAVRYFSNASDLMPMLKQGKLSVGLLPEPALTKLQTVVAPEFKYALDLQELYDENLKSYPQAVLMVKKSILSSELLGEIKSKLTDSIAYLNDDFMSAVDSVNGALKEGLVPSLTKDNITAQVIKRSKIYFTDSATEKQNVLDYIDVISGIEPKSVNKVGEDFFVNENV